MGWVEEHSRVRNIYWSPHGGIARGWPPERIFEAIATAGYAGTEIWMDRAWFDWTRAAEIRRIKDLASRYELETPTVCWRRVPTLEPTNPATAAAARDYLRDCLRVAEACGAATVLVYPGVPEGVAHGDSWATARDIFGGLDAECRTRVVRIAIEFESPGPVLLGTPEETLAFIREVGPHVTACADTYHLYNRGIDPYAGVMALQGHLSLVHLSDSGRQMPGKGEVDYPRFFAGLRDIGYDGPLFVQYGPERFEEFALGLERAREYARALGEGHDHGG